MHMGSAPSPPFDVEMIRKLLESLSGCNRIDKKAPGYENAKQGFQKSHIGCETR